jgi:hypothetical protein
MNQLQRTEALQRHLRGEPMLLEIYTDYGTKITLVDTSEDYVLVQTDIDADQEIERVFYARTDEGLQRAHVYAKMCVNGGGEYFF